jgi:type IX secretion system PorP/SprF family membrane protein
MKKIFVFLFLYIIAILAAIAQMDPQFTFNKVTLQTVNPAYAGSEEMISGVILNRVQWVGIDGAPKTMIFSVGRPVKIFGANSGIGLNLMNDKIGFYKNISVSFDYDYRLQTSIGELGIGTSLGVFNMSINPSWYVPDGDYYSDLSGSTESFPTESSRVVFDMGVGAFLHTKKYFIGISSTHISQPTIKFSGEARTYLARHYYLSGGYNINLPDPLFELQPSVYLKTDGAAYQIDCLLNVVYKSKFSGGLNYRINDAVSILLGFEMNSGIKVGYAYDLVTSALFGHTGGSHEIYLSYSFDLEKNRSKKYKSVRYL